MYKEILPDKCRVRVSPGKRVTVTLKKLDASHSWPLRPPPKQTINNKQATSSLSLYICV